MEPVLKKGNLTFRTIWRGETSPWETKFCVLYGHTRHHIPRLDYYSTEKDFEGSPAVRQTCYVSEMKSIHQSNAADTLNAFEVYDIRDVTRIYTAENKNEMLDWLNVLNRLQQEEFKTDDSKRTSRLIGMIDGIVSSESSDDQFTVVVTETATALHCQLSGVYKLCVGKTGLVLLDTDGNQIYDWPYLFVRRFGNNQQCFIFEAGRKCASGAGVFMLQTSRAEEILQCVQKRLAEVRSKGSKVDENQTTNTTSETNEHVSKENTLTRDEQSSPKIPTRGYRNTYENIPVSEDQLQLKTSDIKLPVASNKPIKPLKPKLIQSLSAGSEHAYKNTNDRYSAPDTYYNQNKTKCQDTVDYGRLSESSSNQQHTIVSSDLKQDNLQAEPLYHVTCLSALPTNNQEVSDVTSINPFADNVYSKTKDIHKDDNAWKSIALDNDHIHHEVYDSGSVSNLHNFVDTTTKYPKMSEICDKLNPTSTATSDYCELDVLRQADCPSPSGNIYGAAAMNRDISENPYETVG